tara:strand:- start:290 stop:502 length:213 start_codon:yes stop_codon:yes gene_type:complete
MPMPKMTNLNNFDFNHVIPSSERRKIRKLNTDPPAISKELGTAKGPTLYGKPLSPAQKKQLKELLQKRET